MTWTDKFVGSKEERAVSPVIGVILMVAITVILAAVIAAFVMDIGPGDTNANAAIEYDEGADQVELVSLEGQTNGIAVVGSFDDSEELTDGTTSIEESTTTAGDTLSTSSGSAIIAYIGEVDDSDSSQFSELDTVTVLEDIS